EVLVLDQHADRHRDLLPLEAEDRVEDPDRVGQDQVGHPGALRDERLGSIRLPGIVSSDQADQEVRVNGAHACAARASGYLPSGPRVTVAWGETRRGLCGSPPK